MITFDIDQVDGTTVIRPHGRLNMASAPQLSKTVRDLVGDGKARFVVDLSQTSCIDSSGLGALVAALKSARTAGGDLRLAATTPQIDTVLELTNLKKVLQPSRTVADACKLL
jgi:anti-sigma B factor antagonist